MFPRKLADVPIQTTFPRSIHVQFAFFCLFLNTNLRRFIKQASVDNEMMTSTSIWMWEKFKTNKWGMEFRSVEGGVSEKKIDIHDPLPHRNQWQCTRNSPKKSRGHNCISGQSRDGVLEKIVNIHVPLAVTKNKCIIEHNERFIKQYISTLYKQ